MLQYHLCDSTFSVFLTKYKVAQKEEDKEELISLLARYKKFKNNYAKNLKFDPNYQNLGKLNLFLK